MFIAVVVNARGVMFAVSRLKPHKKYGSCGLSIDHFPSAGSELSAQSTLRFCLLCLQGVTVCMFCCHSHNCNRLGSIRLEKNTVQKYVTLA